MSEESMENGQIRQRLLPWDYVYSLDMAIACLLTWWVLTSLLGRIVDKPSDLLGGMWAVVATIFVFRETRLDSLAAGLARLIATCVSFALCLVYLLLLPFNAVGLAALVGIGMLLMMVLGRRGDIVTTGITTAVVMVVAGLSPQDAWQQPVLRLVDTLAGVAIGVFCKWIGSFAFYKLAAKPVR